MNAIFWLIDTVINLYTMVIVAQVVLSWLVSFNVVNTQNRFIYMIGDFLHRATEPALKPIRKFMPNLGSLDIAPIVLIIGLIFLRRLIVYDIATALH
jgi:YggT family protein